MATPASEWLQDEDFEPIVSREFIEEMAVANLLAIGSGRPSKRLRRKEKGYAHSELQWMKRAHYESAVFNVFVENSKKESSTAVSNLSSLPAFQPAKLCTGQTVQHWWASWFKTATEPKTQIGGKKGGKQRPEWYDATIVTALGVNRVMYAGRWFEEHTYQVH